jgi:Putative beta-barrel porin 2
MLKAITFLLIGATLGAHEICAETVQDRLKIGLSGFYDSNFLRSADGNLIVRPDRTADDFVWSPSVSVTPLVNLGLQSVALDGRLAYRLHTSNQEFNAVEYSLRGQWNWTAGSRCSGDVSAGFLDAPGKLEDDLSLSPSRAQEQNYTLTGVCTVSPDLKASLVFRRTIARYKAQSQSTNALDQNNLTGRVGWSPSERLSVAGVFAYESLRQPNVRFGSFDDFGVEAEIWQLGSDIQFDVTPKIKLAVRPAYLKLTDSAGLRNRTGIVGKAAISWAYSPKVDARLEVDRTLASSASIGAIGYQLDTLAAEATWRADAKWTAGVQLSRSWQNALRRVRQPFFTDMFRQINDQNSAARLDLTYIIGNTVTANTSLQYSRRVSSDSRLSYSSKRVFVQLEYTLK